MINVQQEIDAEAEFDLPDPPENDRGPGAWLNLPEDFRETVSGRLERGMQTRIDRDLSASRDASETIAHARGWARKSRLAREARDRAEDQKRRAGRATLADYGLSRSTARGRS